MGEFDGMSKMQSLTCFREYGDFLSKNDDYLIESGVMDETEFEKASERLKKETSDLQEQIARLRRSMDEFTLYNNSLGEAVTRIVNGEDKQTVMDEIWETLNEREDEKQSADELAEKVFVRKSKYKKIIEK